MAHGGIAVRKRVSDPVGEYWREYAPVYSSAWLYGQLPERVRDRVYSNCWLAGKFDVYGQLDCRCRQSFQCKEELRCEILAALLLIPPGNPVYGRDESLEVTQELAQAYQVDVDTLVFRQVLEQWVQHLARTDQVAYVTLVRIAGECALPALGRLAQRLGVRDIIGDQLMQSKGICLPTEPGGHRFQILLRDDNREDPAAYLERRFTLVHELAHIIHRGKFSLESL